MPPAAAMSVPAEEARAKAATADTSAGSHFFELHDAEACLDCLARLGNGRHLDAKLFLRRLAAQPRRQLA